jgi:hypothetical protein
MHFIPILSYDFGSYCWLDVPSASVQEDCLTKQTLIDEKIHPMSRDSRKQNMTKKECENNGHCCKMTAANFIEMLQLINDCIDVFNMV